MPAPTHLSTVHENARALRERGDLAGATIMLEHAIETGGAAYGIDHPDVLETARMLADLHRETGDLAAARRTLEEALAGGQLSLPEQHPLMLLLAYDLGLVADELGNRHEARRNFATVARLGPAALGGHHPSIRAAMSYLAGEASTPPPATEHPPHAAPIAPPVRFSPTFPDQPPQLTQAMPRRGRTALVVAAVVAGVAVAAAGTTAVLLSGMRPEAKGPPGPVTTTSATTPPPSKGPRPGPTEVRLRDDGTSITLTWRDPSGTVPFIVAGGRAGEQARTFANLPAGHTTYTMNGLNPRLEYCFTIVAVYSTESFTASELVCTKRGSRNPQPTRS